MIIRVYNSKEDDPKERNTAKNETTLKFNTLSKQINKSESNTVSFMQLQQALHEWILHQKLS